MTDPNRRRSIVVWGVCASLWVLAVLMAFAAALIYAEIGRRQSHGGAVSSAAWTTVAIDAALSVVYAALAYLIFRGIRWARTATIILIGLNVAIGLAATVVLGSAGSLLGLLPQAALLALLWHRDVRLWCS